jgi:hypothetical protein
MKEIKLYDQEIIDYMDVNISYLKVTCKKCGKHWGVTLHSSIIPIRALVCESCCTDDILR